MNLIIESHIPYIKGVLEACGHSVTYLPPEEITSETVRDADAIIIRTRTKANAELLSGSKVRHVVTATIGTDHIDTEFCKSHGIRVDNAPGCNAPAVAQYVLSSIAAIYGPSLSGLTLGIVGAGHVGSIVNRWAEAIGMKTLICDPPRALTEGPDGFTDMDTIAAKADIITFHTPLDESTRHLCGDKFLSKVKRTPTIINAARGPVTDTDALISALETGKIRSAVVDCWEGEPQISPRLLDLATIATPHVAGYSAEGKKRATAMAVRAIEPSAVMEFPPVAETPTLAEITATYNPRTDTAELKANPGSFEQLRNCYAYRHEPF